MEQQKLPDSVSTKQGNMSGFRYAEDLPHSKGSIDLRHHEAPRRQRRPGDPEVWTLADALERGARVGAIFETTEGQILVLYKREKYRFFSRHFPNAPGDGPGVTANMKLVHWSALEGIKIATIFPDGSCYSMDAMEFWNFYEKYGTEVASLPGEISCPFEIWTKIF
jgi:hypothetical protein